MIYLDGSSLTIDQVVEIARNKAEVGLSEEAKKNLFTYLIPVSVNS